MCADHFRRPHSSLAKRRRTLHDGLSTTGSLYCPMSSLASNVRYNCRVYLFYSEEKECEPNAHVYLFQPIGLHRHAVHRHLPAYFWCNFRLSTALKCPPGSEGRASAHVL